MASGKFCPGLVVTDDKIDISFLGVSDMIE
jgi:hypothetical protein